MTDNGPQTPLTDLIGMLATQLQRLIRTECRIARAEIGENMGKMRAGAVLTAFGVIILVPALTLLLAGAALSLVNTGWSSNIAAFAVGGTTLAIGVLFAIVGLNRVRAVSLVPEKALTQLQRDVAAVNPMRQHHERSAA